MLQLFWARISNDAFTKPPTVEMANKGPPLQNFNARLSPQACNTILTIKDRGIIAQCLLTLMGESAAEGRVKNSLTVQKGPCNTPHPHVHFRGRPFTA